MMYIFIIFGAGMYRLGGFFFPGFQVANNTLPRPNMEMDHMTPSKDSIHGDLVFIVSPGRAQGERNPKILKN